MEGKHTADKANPILARKNYQSKWDYTLAMSNWHFDKWRQEPDPFRISCRLEGDWTKMIDSLEYELKVGTRGYGYKGKDGDGIIERDFLEWGYRPDMVQFDRTYEVPERLQRIIEPLGLKYPDIRIHRQMPGMVTPIHVDGYSSHYMLDKDPTLNTEDMVRLIIQLRDWDWGHFWLFGNNNWTQWKAGDVAFFDSREIVHATANAGKEPRVTMLVTGWMTETTKQIAAGEFQTFQV